MALVPVENSLEGAINITLDTLAHSTDLEVVRKLIWPVHNQLMSKCAPDEITKIYSHSQPISQCRKFLQENYPNAEIIKVASIARAELGAYIFFFDLEGNPDKEKLQASIAAVAKKVTG